MNFEFFRHFYEWQTQNWLCHITQNRQTQGWLLDKFSINNTGDTCCSLLKIVIIHYFGFFIFFFCFYFLIFKIITSDHNVNKFCMFDCYHTIVSGYQYSNIGKMFTLKIRNFQKMCQMPSYPDSLKLA